MHFWTTFANSNDLTLPWGRGSTAFRPATEEAATYRSRQSTPDIIDAARKHEKMFTYTGAAVGAACHRRS